jgi:predicted dehydrogenase
VITSAGKEALPLMTEPDSPPDAPPLRLGVIGCGRIAQVAHLPAVAKSAAVELVAVCDPSPVLAGAVSHRYSVPGMASAADLLALDLEAVLVAVPDRFHKDIGCAALAAGRHVLMEKPAAVTAAEAEDLAALADKAGLKVQIGAMRRHDPGLQHARSALADLGPVQLATFWYRLPSALRRSTEAALFPPVTVDEQVTSAESAFKADRESYLLRTHGAHVFDAVRYLLGPAAGVRAELFRGGADLHWQGTIQAAAAPATFTISANVHADYSEGIEIFAAQGQVSIRSYFPFYRRPSTVRVFREAALAWTEPDYGAVDPYQRQLEAFARAIREDGPTDPDASDGAAALRLIEASAASAAAGGQSVAALADEATP